MSDHSEAFVAFDTSKLRNAVAIADGGRTGEVRFFGETRRLSTQPKNRSTAPRLR
jgi:hypothetical protein